MFDEFIKDMWQVMYDKRIAIKKKELAERIGISASQLREFVSGRYCSHNVAEKIADYFSMNMIYSEGKYRLADKERIR